MRRAISENPVTTMFMAGFGIFILAGYLMVVQPVKDERYREVRDLCGNIVSFNEDEAASESSRSNNDQ
jgi:hypothetical protein